MGEGDIRGRHSIGTPTRPRPHRTWQAAGRGHPVPELPPFAVRRARLLRLLDLATHQRVTIVAAPPGYGKTVLLAQWAGEATGTRVRWLTLAETHDDEGALARDLGEALGQPATRHSEAPTLPRPALSLVDLAREVEGMPPTTLIVDDFHHLSNRAVVDDFARFIEHAPRALHLVVATRVDPPMPAYRLRLSDALVELRQDDLALTPVEAAELLRRVSHREVTDAQAETLVRRTEGWAAALQLAALSLRHEPDLDAFVEAFLDDESRSADYLIEEVLRRQPPTIRRFLLATSVLYRMSGPLCDFVTGTPGSQALLEDLDRTSLFITPLDERHRWYRYHHLFRSLLRHHLRDEHPTMEPELLRRAAEWHLAHDEVEASITYLTDLGAWDDVLDVAFARAATLLARGELPMLVRWLERVPAAVRRRRPDAMLLLAAALFMAGDNRARSVLDAVAAMPSAPPGDRVVADLLRSLLAAQHGDLDLAMASADQTLIGLQAVEDADLPNVLDLSHDRADVAAGAQLTRGAALFHRGDFAEARRALEAVVDDGHPAWQLSALGSLAHLDARSGLLASSERHSARVLTLADELHSEQRITTATFIALTHVALQREQLERATLLLDAADSRWGANLRGTGAALLTVEKAMLALAHGEPDTGLALLAARRAGVGARLPWIVRASRQLAEARLHLELGDLDAAERVLGVTSERELSSLVALRVRLAVERSEPADAHALLERWPNSSPPAERERSLWMAILDHAAGDERASLDRLAPVVAAADLEGDIGLFRAAGRHVLAPVRSLQRVAPTAFLRTIVEGATTGTARRIGPVTEIVEQLTEREYMVLTLIPSRLSNVEIAARLGVSLNTVKTHLKHIYRKLDVMGRNEAIERAERLGLL